MTWKGKTMTVAELIAELQAHDPDMEVKMVYQSNYPLQADISEVMILTKGGEDAVYLTEGTTEYGPRGW